MDFESETFIAFGVQEDNQNGCCIRDTAGSIRADAPGSQPGGTLALVEVTHSLTEGFDGSEDGTGRGGPIVPVVMPLLECGARTGKSTDDPRAGIGIGQDGDPMFTLQGGKQHGVAVAFRTAGDGAVYEEGDKTAPLTTNTDPSANVLAFNLRGREGGSQPEVTDVASVRASHGGSSRSYVADFAVRRLTVVEVARLQGFPDTYAHIEYGRPRKIEADEAAYLTHHGIKCWQDGERWITKVAADGNMYKAYGNSWAIPVIRWIGERINKAEKAKEGKI